MNIEVCSAEHAERLVAQLKAKDEEITALRAAIGNVHTTWLADDGTAKTELAIDDAIEAAVALCAARTASAGKGAE